MSVDLEAVLLMRKALDAAPCKSTKMAFVSDGVTYTLDGDGTIERADGEPLSSGERESISILVALAVADSQVAEPTQ